MSVEFFEDHSPDVDITFTKGDLRDVVPHDNNPIVISLVTAGRTVHRVLVDQGSSADVMFWPTFEKLQLSPDQLRPYGGCLYGFVGDQVEVRGYIELRTTFTNGVASQTEKIRYLVMNAPSTYNILLERPTLNRTGVVPSTRHMKVKLPIMEGLVITICSDQKEAKKCYENSLKNKRSICHVTITPPHGVEPEPIRQRRRKFNEEKRQAIKDETQKLLVAGHIREIQYPEWLANVVLVKKSSGKWQMCVDFTDLNKACPKDSYALPSIDALVDSASGWKLLSFLDAFSGYNQIKMHPMDEEKTAFMTERSCYCYKVMPFGLKNAGATYQRLMDKVLASMLGRNVQAYVDNMVVTSLEKSRHVADLEELFVTIARYKLKLNPEKCIFGVEAGKFLGFLLSERGIEANPDKCAAILAMRSPATMKEVQRLTGRMVALSRFVSASGEKGHPYFQCLKRNNRFV